MGYYTKFNMVVMDVDQYKWLPEAGRITNDPYVQYVIEGYLNRIPLSGYEFRDLRSISDDKYKWYEYDNDMRELSEKFPRVVFILYGDGDGTFDHWRAVYNQGNVVEQQASIDYGPLPSLTDLKGD